MKTTIDIKKAQYVTFGYVNQEGDRRSRVLQSLTVHGCEFNINQYAYPLDHKYPKETLLERALRLEILDRWTSCVTFTFNKFDRIEIRGDLALDLYHAYNAYIFGKQNKKKGKK